jgi:hypothetical protein
MVSVTVYLPADVADQVARVVGQTDALISRWFLRAYIRNASGIDAAIPQPEDWEIELGLPRERRWLEKHGVPRSIKIRKDHRDRIDEHSRRLNTSRSALLTAAAKLELGMKDGPSRPLA